jgi:hypothetical protein
MDLGVIGHQQQPQGDMLVVDRSLFTPVNRNQIHQQQLAGVGQSYLYERKLDQFPVFLHR